MQYGMAWETGKIWDEISDWIETCPERVEEQLG